MNDKTVIRTSNVMTVEDHLRARIENQRLEIERLRGLKPELPPRAPDGEGLPRYGLRWNGPHEPMAVPMDDGFWTPWHLAAKAHGNETRAGAAMREAGNHVFCGATPNWIDHAGDCDALPCTCGLSEWLNSNQDLLGITLSPSQKAGEQR